MKKQAYTLAEVLITLSIIGILAAVLVPLANKFKPDKNKAMFLKTYDTIVKAVRELAGNTTIYPLVDDKYSYIKAPLAYCFLPCCWPPAYKQCCLSYPNQS